MSSLAKRIRALLPLDIVSIHHDAARLIQFNVGSGQKMRWLIEYPRHSGVHYRLSSLVRRLHRHSREVEQPLAFFPMLPQLLVAKHQPRSKAESTMTTKVCCVCLSPHPLVDTIVTPCQRRHTCGDCTVHFLQSHLFAPSPTDRLPCPCGECGMRLEDTHVEALCNVLVFHHASLPDFFARFQMVKKKAQLVEQVRVAGVDQRQVPIQVILECPECHDMSLINRNETQGVPLFSQCQKCEFQFCSGCRHHTSASSHVQCRQAWHSPATLHLDFGSADCRQLQDLTLEQRQNCFHHLEHLLRQFVADAVCPQCYCLLSKDDACTHLTCETGQEGCRHQFCFFCKGTLAKTMKQYSEVLRHPTQCRSLALVSQNLPLLFQPSRHVNESIFDAHLPQPQHWVKVHALWHNDGFAQVFDPDSPQPSGRCPGLLEYLRIYPWFRHLKSDLQYLERWNELHLLRRLHQWGLHPPLLAELLAHRQSPCRDWDIIRVWLQRGQPLVSAHQPYLTATSSLEPQYSSQICTSSFAQQWSRRHLEWQRWVVAKIPPTSEKALIVLE